MADCLQWTPPSQAAQENARALAKMFAAQPSLAVDLLEEAIFDDSDKYNVFDERIPNEYNRASIGASIFDPDQVRYWAESMRYFGHGVFALPFAVILHAEVHYQATKPDFQALSAERVKAAITKPDEDGGLYVTEGAMLHLRGLVALAMTDKSDVDRFEGTRLADEDLQRFLIAPSIGCLEDIAILDFREPVQVTAGE